MAQFPITYRVTRIPELVGREDFDVAFRNSVRLTRPSDLKLHSFSTDSSDSSQPKNRTATISIKTRPSHLPDEESKKSHPIILEIAGGSEIKVYVDAHFQGFTPLSPMKPDNSKSIDCVFIHGYGGHAFRSFRAARETYMWPRDSLAAEVPELDLWTYGYVSGTKGKDRSHATVEDFAITFINLLRELRNAVQDGKAKPIIFVAHSLGGLILKEVLINLRASEDKTDRINFICTYGIIFFGVPSQGMHVEDLAAMVGSHPQGYTLTMLNEDFGSRLKMKRHKEFCKAFDFRDSEIVQFYETTETETMKEVMDKETGETQWLPTGRPQMLVKTYSALGGQRPWENDDSRFMIPIEANHKTLVKFDPNQLNDYMTVRQTFQRFVRDSRAVIVARFRNQVIQVRHKQREACRIAKGSYTFAALDDSPEFITRPTQGQKISNWEHVTSKSILLYEKMYQECSDIYPRVGLPAFQEQFPTSIHPIVDECWSYFERCGLEFSRNMKIALIYMIHLRVWTDLEMDDLPITDENCRFLKSYGNWVPCNCKPECGRMWNFANGRGLRRGVQLTSRCRMEERLRSTRSDEGLLTSKSMQRLRGRWLGVDKTAP